MYDEAKADDSDVMDAEDVRKWRKAFSAERRLRCRGVTENLEGAEERLLTVPRY